ASARVAGILRARVAVVTVGGRAGRAGSGHAGVVQAAARAVLAGRAVGRGRRAAGTARGVAAPGLVAGVEREADDRIAADAASRLACVATRALVAVAAGGPVGLGRIRARAGVRVAPPGVVTLIGGRAGDRGAPHARAVLA